MSVICTQPPMHPLPQTALRSLSPSSALPGDALNSTVDATGDSPPSPSPESPRPILVITNHRQLHKPTDAE